MSKMTAFALADYERVREAQKAGEPHPDPDFSEMERHQADLNAAVRGAADGLEYALAAILDCHTRIVARHVPSPRVRRVRAGYRDRSLRASLALRSERR